MLIRNTETGMCVWHRDVHHHTAFCAIGRADPTKQLGVVLRIELRLAAYTMRRRQDVVRRDDTSRTNKFHRAVLETHIQRG